MGILPAHHPFVGRDIPWLLDARAAARAEHCFLIFQPLDGDVQRWTYSRFARGVERVAAAMRDHGVREGDFVLLHMDNCPEFLLVWHACLRLGAVVVATGTRVSAVELSYFIEHSKARFAFTQPGYEALVRAAGPRLAWIAVTATDAGARPQDEPSAQALAFDRFLESGGPEHVRRPADPARLASVLFTSGTTARPKGVVWTHANALWGARLNAYACDVRPEDIGHSCLPLHHTNALSYSHLATLWAGATLVLQPRFSASRYWRCIVDHGVTWGVQIPFMLNALKEQPMPAGHRIGRWGLGSLDSPRWRSHFGIPLIGWFGMTETVAMPIFSARGVPGRAGTMGTPAMEYEVAIRREDGSAADFEESGYLWIRGVRGLSMFLEYLHDADATAAAFDADGWFFTGDLVTAFPDGHIRFDGRGRDILRIGGENVAESEIEAAIMAAGGISECAVVGKPDPMLDEVPIAFVVASGDPARISERIATLCVERLADFKRPREVRIVDALPRVTLGKIDKKELRRRLSEEQAES